MNHKSNVLEKFKRRFINEKDTAALLCTTPKNLQNLRYLGQGPPYYKGDGKRGRIVYDYDEVVAWMDKRKVVPGKGDEDNISEKHKSHKIKKGDWVVSPSEIGRVRNIWDDGTVDVVIYDRTGRALGRTSPPMGGPTAFEPCCNPSGWKVIDPPNFPLPKYEYLRNCVRVCAPEEFDRLEGKHE